MRPSEAHLLKFNVQVSQLLNNDFLVTVDVDARNAWHAVELNTHQVVVSVVGLSVNTNGADSGWSLADNHHERLLQTLAACLLNGDVVLTTFLNLEVRTIHEVDVSIEHIFVDQEEANVISVLATKPLPATSQVVGDKLEFGIS